MAEEFRARPPPPELPIADVGGGRSSRNTDDAHSYCSSPSELIKQRKAVHTSSSQVYEQKA
jgi:hypothetical protein